MRESPSARVRNGFDLLSVDYARYRPGYPDALAAHLADRCGVTRASAILDVGAGTGKASAMWHGRGPRTVSAEQSLAMIAQGRLAFPGLRYVCANAESLGVSSASFDVITSGQAFHLFDAARALPEFARALKPRGFLAVFFYRLDMSAPPMQAFADLLVSYDMRHEWLDQAGSRDWHAGIEMGGCFAIVEQRQFPFAVPMTPEDWVGLVRTVPGLRAAGAAFECSLRDRMSGAGASACPYLADLWLARRTT